MREVKFILPKRSSAPSSDPEHAFARKALVEAFGGFTTYDSRGGWRNSAGAVMLEPSITYVAAIIQSDGLGNFARFHEIALQAGRMAEQEAVYIVGPTGDAEIVSLVDVGKVVIQADTQAAAKDAPQRPQVGDFWETADGTKVYIERKLYSDAGFHMRVIGPCNSTYAAELDGRYCMYAPGPHPYHLKRFIGR